MSGWVSMHIFHSGSLDRLLVEGVRPTVERLRAGGAVERWFFIRYWNGGPHLRLRLKARRGDEAGVAATAYHDLGEYLTRHPAGPVDVATYWEQARQISALCDASGEPEEIEPPQPANSVQRRAYRYETERYGGPHARTLAEGHFSRSSELALTLVSRSPGLLRARTSLAAELLALMPVALGWPLEQARLLFLEAGRIGRSLDKLAVVPFEDQRDALVSLVRCAGERRHDLSSLPALTLHVWRKELELLSAGLAHLSERGELAAPPDRVLMSCAHMLNNRLGLGAAYEYHLFGLLARAFEDAGEIAEPA